MIWQVGLYAAAVLIPLAAFAVEAIFIRQLKRYNAYLATGAIGLSCLLSADRFRRLLDREQVFRACTPSIRRVRRNTAPPPNMAKAPTGETHHTPSSGPAVSTG